MSILRKKFYSFDVELRLYEEHGEERSWCFIEKDGAVSSLAAAEAFGVLDDSGREVPIADSIVEKIGKWACANGY